MQPSLVVDGYNVIYAWDDLRPLVTRSLELARERLLARLAVFAQMTGTPVEVVFDAHGTTAMRSREQLRDGVRVLFTRRGQSADHVIERLAYQAREARRPFTVATSDRFHGEMLRGMGAAVMDARELRRQVEDAERELANRLRGFAQA